MSTSVTHPVTTVAAVAGPQLTERDQRLLLMVHAYHGCAVEHLHRRLWPPGSGLSTCYRRVSHLTRAGYLATVRTSFLLGRGSTRALITPGSAAGPLLAHLLGTLPERLQRIRPPARSPLHLAHHLAICDTRLSFELAAEHRDDVILEDFLPEITLRRHPLLVDGTPLVPDGAFSLRHRGRAQRAYLEVDMGTTFATRLRLKLQAYLHHHATEPVVPVFFVAPDLDRVEEILALVTREAATLHADPTPFFATTSSLLTPETALAGSIWRQAGVKHPVAILPAPSGVEVYHAP